MYAPAVIRFILSVLLLVWLSDNSNPLSLDDEATKSVTCSLGFVLETCSFFFSPYRSTKWVENK